MAGFLALPSLASWVLILSSLAISSAKNIRFNASVVAVMQEVAHELHLPPGLNWADGALYSDDGMGTGFRGVICDDNGFPISIAPTIPDGEVAGGFPRLQAALAKLTTVTLISLNAFAINAKLSSFAQVIQCLPKLKHLDLSVNSLYGPIPPYLTQSSSIEFLLSLPASSHLIDCDVSQNCLIGGSTATCPSLSAQRTHGRCSVAKKACNCFGGKVCVPVYNRDNSDGSSEGVEDAGNPPDAWVCSKCPLGTFHFANTCVSCRQLHFTQCYKQWVKSKLSC